MYQYTHSIKISAFCHLKWLSYSRKTEISNYKKGDNEFLQKGDNISKYYVCLTVIIDIARKITIFKILMRNDDVIAINSLNIYIYIQARFAACGHCVSAELPCGRLELLNLNYFGIVFSFIYMYIVNKGQRIIFHMNQKI